MRDGTKRDETTSRTGERRWLVLFAVLGAMLIVATIAVPIALRIFVVESFKIPTGAMIPTILVGDHIFVRKTNGETADIERGDVVLFDFPQESAREHLAKKSPMAAACIHESTLEGEPSSFISRVVAVSGDTVSVRSGQLFINDRPVAWEKVETTETGDYRDKIVEREILPGESEGHLIQRFPYAPGSDFEAIDVPEGHLFVMGDNRDNSSDSRCWGPVPVDRVAGVGGWIWYSTSSEAEGRVGTAF